MIHHVVGLFTHPDQEWKEIRGDQEESISHMYLTHTLILAAIPAVSAFIGTTQVGWVIGNPSRHLAEPPDLRFYAQQQRTMLWTAGLALLLAALAALVSARSLLRPIRELAGATHRLAAGDYHIRVTDNRRDELGALAHDFNQLAHALARNETLRRQLIADVSHELRTPLAVLRGEIEALEDGVRPLTPEALGSLAGEVALDRKSVV